MEQSTSAAGKTRLNGNDRRDHTLLGYRGPRSSNGRPSTDLSLLGHRGP